MKIARMKIPLMMRLLKSFHRLEERVRLLPILKERGKVVTFIDSSFDERAIGDQEVGANASASFSKVHYEQVRKEVAKTAYVGEARSLPPNFEFHHPCATRASIVGYGVTTSSLGIAPKMAFNVDKTVPSFGPQSAGLSASFDLSSRPLTPCEMLKVMASE
ncbi:hypothetical protein QYF36_024861 [Acer negundo]|nr:hypothetical protein QYF36_024861 [Acer negundo]